MHSVEGKEGHRNTASEKVDDNEQESLEHVLNASSEVTADVSEAPVVSRGDRQLLSYDDLF